MHSNGRAIPDVQRELAAVRAELARDIRATVSDARTLADWRYHYRNHPWLATGAMALLGYWIVPRRNAASRRGLADFAVAAVTTRPAEAGLQQPASSLQALLTMAATYAAKQAAIELIRKGRDRWAARAHQKRAVSEQSPCEHQGHDSSR